MTRFDPVWLSARQQRVGFPLETSFESSERNPTLLSSECNYFLNCERKSACINECGIVKKKEDFSIQILEKKKNIIWTAGVARRVEIVEIHGGRV